MKVALIYPQIHNYPDFTSLKTYRRNLGVYPPLSLAYVAAIIKKSGHDVIIIDAHALNLNSHDIIERIKSFSPDILGFTVTTITFHHLLSYIRTIKKEVALPILIGGALTSLYPREIMHHQEIDYTLVGEVEQSLKKFLSIYEEGKDFSQVPGFCARKGKEVIITQAANPIEDIDSVPFPARYLLPNEKYHSFISHRKNFTTMITSRGCLFRCIYCSLLKKLQLRSVKNVVDEIEECYTCYGIRDIDFYDATFTVDRNRTINICQEITKRKLDINWAVRTRVDLIDRDLLWEMAKAGCKTVMYGIESSDPTILRRLGRAVIDTKQIRDVIRWTNKARISALGFFMLGAPGETVNSINDTIQFSKQSNLDYAQFTKITPFPGTELYEEYKKEHHKEDYWRHVIFEGTKAERIFPLVGTNLSTQTVLKYVKKAHLKFYLRPLYLIKILSKIKSIKRLFRFTKAAIDLIFFNN
ncbi:MAG: B12-binding domain-containing radical SAM protein [Candidatus Omnitrophica bacterium]|nr:B12-binding domain-containing radical SAM protein [Candidatus Omnitrophota bacterium]